MRISEESVGSKGFAIYWEVGVKPHLWKVLIVQGASWLGLSRSSLSLRVRTHSIASFSFLFLESIWACFTTCLPVYHCFSFWEPNFWTDHCNSELLQWVPLYSGYLQTTTLFIFLIQHFLEHITACPRNSVVLYELPYSFFVNHEVPDSNGYVLFGMLYVTCCKHSLSGSPKVPCTTEDKNDWSADSVPFSHSAVEACHICPQTTFAASLFTTFLSDLLVLATLFLCSQAN